MSAKTTHQPNEAFPLPCEEQELRKEEALFLKALNLEKSESTEEGLAIAEELIAKYSEVDLAEPAPVSLHGIIINRQLIAPPS